MIHVKRTAQNLALHRMRKGMRNCLWAGLLLASGVLLAASSASAMDANTDRSINTRDTRPALSIIEAPAPIGKQATRAPRFSLFDVSLPLAFRARLGGVYTYTPFLVDALAYDRRNRLGPAVRTHHFFESRFSIGRAVRPGIELELAWSSQSAVSVSHGPSFDRQIVGAFLRFER